MTTKASNYSFTCKVDGKVYHALKIQFLLVDGKPYAREYRVLSENTTLGIIRSNYRRIGPKNGRRKYWVVNDYTEGENNTLTSMHYTLELAIELIYMRARTDIPTDQSRVWFDAMKECLQEGFSYGEA